MNALLPKEGRTKYNYQLPSNQDDMLEISTRVCLVTPTNYTKGHNINLFALNKTELVVGARHLNCNQYSV